MDAKPQTGEEITWRNQKNGMPPVPASTGRDCGAGPFKRLVLRGATIIDGTGAPPWGPADIVIENDRIAAIVAVGTPGKPISPSRRPAAGDQEIDCHGKFVTPGLIDCHAHAGVPYHALHGTPAPADYVYKLWLAHGVTTAREMGGFSGLGWMLEQKKASQENRIAAPHLVVHSYFPAVNDMLKTLHTPDEARSWLRDLKSRGADGVKFFGAPPAIMKAALAECRELGLRTGCHHAQQAVTRMNALTTAEWGLTSAEHYYGLPEALYDNRVVQSYPAGYNYNDEYFRFSSAGQTFQQAAEPGSAKWNEVMERFLALDFTFVPTFSIYDANRDVMRTRRADWHDDYTWPSMWRFFQPARGGHGSYWFKWSTGNEIDWKQHYRLWMTFLNEYKNRGGRVCTGSDSGFIFQTYGFGYVRELELLQEAGFNPLEVLRSATIQSAELLGVDAETGSIETGKRADLLVLDENPLEDFKLLYATGALRLNDATGQVEWRQALRHTIRAGLVFDIPAMLADIRKMVADQKALEAEAAKTPETAPA
ncbi:amidohydrolase family protein [Roseomonas sp. 18066]|uniref:amidohydrolase family protein n=1 Tax=Roseomonas sp. 18066 TaxID=2681412 RepID=UPI00135B7412|nr:amidohydrolase family protein [Roseomonas sp. 18066]